MVEYLDVYFEKGNDLMNGKRKIAAIIAVRMDSKRLPKKAIADIEGYTAIERVVNNLKPSKYIDDIIIATSTNEENEPIEDLAMRCGISIFRGDERNVVKRYIDAAEKFNANTIVRVTGDCPLVSYEIADYLIVDHLEKRAEFTTMESDGPPIGTLSEIIELSALKKLMHTNLDLSYSEYMTFYFKCNPSYFSINMVACPPEFMGPEFRLTLDYPEDLELFRCIFKNLNSGKEAIQLAKTLLYLKEHPEVSRINKNMPIRWKDDAELVKKLKTVSQIST
jgi:spore coat polysaccharide biosynthesis protein SpsF (cytidylyltransferase family)